MQGSASALSLHPAIFHRRSIEETQLCPALVFCSGGPMDEQSEAWPWSSPGQQLPGSRVDSWPLLILTTTLSEKLLRKWAEIETGVVALSFPCVL